MQYVAIQLRCKKQALKRCILKATKKHLKVAFRVLCVTSYVQYQVFRPHLRKDLVFHMVFYFIIPILFKKKNPNQGSKEWELVISLNLNTVCLLNELATLPRKQPSANKRAGSDLATMSRLCKHLIITIKLSINMHYCSLFKHQPTSSLLDKKV